MGVGEFYQGYERMKLGMKPFRKDRVDGAQHKVIKSAYQSTK